jgi:hypothetical protein
MNLHRRGNEFFWHWTWLVHFRLSDLITHKRLADRSTVHHLLSESLKLVFLSLGPDEPKAEFKGFGHT